MDVETTPLLCSGGSAPASRPVNKDYYDQQETNNDKTTVVVDFAPLDPTNPVHFPAGYKYAIVTLLALMAFVVTFTCIGIVPVASRIVTDLSPSHTPDKSASVLLVTIWELGEAAGPLLIAPLSEIYGRYPIVNLANLAFILATVAAALSQNTGLFIAVRALTGFTVMSNVLNPAVVGDLFESEQRGKPMSLIMLAPLLGGAVGPLMAGAMSERFSWRAVLWASVLLASACELLFLTCFRETYGPAILRRRAARLRLERGGSNSSQDIRTPFDDGKDEEEKDKKSALDKLVGSLLRPGIIFFSSPVLMAMALYGSVSFTYFYIMSTTLPDIVHDNYGLSASQVGAVFVAFSIGSIAGVAICNLTLDRIFDKQWAGEPEFRLPLVIVGAVTLPIVVAAYGWMAQAGAGPEGTAPLIALEALLAAMGLSLLLAFMPLLAYVVDATGVYSASAMTAMIVTRCLMGTFLPLAGSPYTRTE
ncbi:hypothetical protein DV737_g401, partial [Chaetothyriales sp. CBS 132003]